MILLRMLDDVFGRGPLVATEAPVAVVASQVNVNHLGVVAHTDLHHRINC